LDSIKRIIKEKYHFRNKVENVVFIGYDDAKCKEDSSYKKNIPQQYLDVPPVSYVHQDKDQTPVDAAFILMFGAIILLSLTGGFVSWKYGKRCAAKIKGIIIFPAPPIINLPNKV
jgi:hypothetical protein